MRANIWRRLGPQPDYRRARLLLEGYLPDPFRPCLPPKGMVLLAYLTLFFWRQGVGGSSHRGVHPSQRWLGLKIGCSPRWAWELVHRLRQAGLVDSRRCFYRGKYTCSLYYPGGALLRMLYAATRSRSKARPRPDDLAASWREFCKSKGINPATIEDTQVLP